MNVQQEIAEILSQQSQHQTQAFDKQAYSQNNQSQFQGVSSQFLIKFAKLWRRKNLHRNFHKPLLTIFL